MPYSSLSLACTPPRVSAVQSLLNHMYGVSEKLAFGPHVIQLYQLASEVKMPELRATCEQVLINGVRASNAAQLMHLAEAYDSKYIRDACLAVTAEGMQDVVQSDAYRDLIEARPDLVQHYTFNALDRLRKEQSKLIEQRTALEKLINEERSLMADKKAILAINESSGAGGQSTKWKSVAARRVELMQRAATSIKSSSEMDRKKFAQNVFKNMHNRLSAKEKLNMKNKATSPVIAMATAKRREETARARSGSSSIKKSTKTPVMSYAPDRDKKK